MISSVFVKAKTKSTFSFYRRILISIPVWGDYDAFVSIISIRIGPWSIYCKHNNAPTPNTHKDRVLPVLDLSVPYCVQPEDHGCIQCSKIISDCPIHNN